MKKIGIILGIFLIVTGSSSFINAVSFKNNTGISSHTLNLKWYLPASVEGGKPQEKWGKLDGSDMPKGAIGFAIFALGNKEQLSTKQEALTPGVNAYELTCDGPSIFSKEAGQVCRIQAIPISSIEGAPNVHNKEAPSVEGIPNILGIDQVI
jgi:hypothetical protein